MEMLNEIYQLDEDDSKIVASELSSLDATEEGFSEYQEKLSKVWKHKNKEFIAAEQKAFEDRVTQEVEKRLETVQATEETLEEDSQEDSVEVSEASQTENEESSDEVEETLDNLQVEEAAIVNNNESSSEGESLRDRFAKTFKESVKISY
jgi:ABC-type cobalamin/Fe3+-siderophores transport system ATPase subunit